MRGHLAVISDKDAAAIAAAETAFNGRISALAMEVTAALMTAAVEWLWSSKSILMVVFCSVIWLLVFMGEFLVLGFTAFTGSFSLLFFLILLYYFLGFIGLEG